MSLHTKYKPMIIRYTAIAFGILILSIGLEMFLTPHKIIPGGIKGLAILLSHVSEMKMGLILLFINLPFVILKNRSLLKTLLALATFLIITILVIFMHPLPPLLDDPLYAAIVGGITFGLGVGLVVRFGWYADGVNEVVYYLKKKVSLSLGEILMFINMIILTLGGFLFGWDQAIYSIIAYFLAYKAIQFALDFHTKQLICITTARSEQLNKMLIREFGNQIEFLTPTHINSHSNNSEVSEVFVVLSNKNIKHFKSMMYSLDPTGHVVVSYANYSQSDSIYKM